MRRRLLFAVLLVLAVFGLEACSSSAVSTSSSTTSLPSTTTTTTTPFPSCRGKDPAGVIAALKPGGVWNGAGKCYLTGAKGIAVPQGVTVENATIDDTASTTPLRAAVHVSNTSGVTLSGLKINGTNTRGVFNGKMVNGAAIDVRSTSNVVITNITTTNTWGDGLTLFWNPRHGQDANVLVDGLTVTNAGRCGFSPTTVTNLVARHLDLISSATPAIDFESDLKGVGLGGFVDISDSKWNGELIAQEYTFPGAYLEFANDQANGLVHFSTGSATTGPGFTQWDGGSMHFPADSHGVNAATLEVLGNRTVLDGVAMSRDPFPRQLGQSPTAWVGNAKDGLPGTLVLQGTTLPAAQVPPRVDPGSQILTQPLGLL